MHILVTDSGVGGLSVVAYADRYLRTRGFAEPVRLTFANAAPSNDYGYNSMPSKEEKVRAFDRFLRRVTERFAPDSIYVACNTLSVLLPETPYFQETPCPVKGIVETGVDLLAKELDEDRRSVALIFGTQTTIDAGTYPRLLAEKGIVASRIVGQACPGLADVISEDRDGAMSAAEIERWVAEALAKLGDRDVPIVAALACTHYGYRKELFAASLGRAGVRSTIVDPNESAVGDLFGEGGETGSVQGDAEISFVTRYPIPEATLDALAFYLGWISPRTIEALRRYEHAADLF
jgi:glutamate racemase